MLTVEQRLRMLACPVGNADMVLDTDAYNEIDDQFAISYALRSPDKLNLRALYAAPFLNERSTSPLDGMEKSHAEILKLLKLAGEERPVFKGSGAYLSGESEPVESPAARDLAGRAEAYSPDHPLYVVAIGAITNVASALLMNPGIADRIVVVWLGGNALDWHDGREFNMMQDVTAARVVYGCGAPVVMLPCAGVVSAFTTTGPELTHWLSGKNPLADYLVRQTIDEASRYASGRVWSRVIWDVTAVAWLLNDGNNLLLDKLILTPIPQYDHHYSFDHRRPLCKYVYHINRDALFADLFKRIGG
ncbi:MAG: nucleoside hydrolase [Oscillospiraceae bacterium]|jgi:inosine-uridine nucleoside N-ribohydrolase|nr:nucleoside hydrolase [Oscillospiraceae bacterium]